MASFERIVHQHAVIGEGDDFVQVFGTSNYELKSCAKAAVCFGMDDGLYLLSTPINHQKHIKGRTAAAKR
jgi:hypothetical protein